MQRRLAKSPEPLTRPQAATLSRKGRGLFFRVLYPIARSAATLGTHHPGWGRLRRGTRCRRNTPFARKWNGDPLRSPSDVPNDSRPTAYVRSSTGTRTSPAWWQLLRFSGDPLGLLAECHQRYGDAFTLNIAGHGQFVMLSDPEVVREVFRGDPEVLHSGEARRLFTATLGRHSVLVLDEAPHSRQRRVLVPPLKGERMRAFFDAMRAETLDAARAWPRDAPGPALPIMRRLTLRVILRTALGLAPGPERWTALSRKIETFLANGRQRYALVLITIIPIDRFQRLSRWVPLFRQLQRLGRRPVCTHRGAWARRTPANRRKRARRFARGDAR